VELAALGKNPLKSVRWICLSLHQDGGRSGEWPSKSAAEAAPASPETARQELRAIAPMLRAPAGKGPQSPGSPKLYAVCDVL